MCDSNGVQTKPAEGTNVVETSEGFGADQVNWFTNSVKEIHALDADVKISMAYHIQSTIFSSAFQKYDEYNGMTSSSNILYDPLNLDTLETADDTDFGYLGRAMKGGWYNASLSINKLKELGVDSIFVGHEHCNSVSIVYEGIRFQYGQKSSQYDRYNSTKDGEIFGGYINDHPSGSTALMGGTVIPVSAEDGSIGTGYICYYGDPFGTESGGEEVKPIVVNGVPVTDPQSGITLTAEAFNETINAYKVVASAQGKVFIDPALVANKTTLTFTVYVEEEIGNSAFLIRLKPDQGFTNLTQDGKHILYQYSSSVSDNRRVVVGEWKTFSVDISAFGTSCTEFSFIVFAGQTIWLRDITIV